MADYPHCAECDRPMRPWDAKLADHPGTIRPGGWGMCVTHFRHAQLRGKPIPDPDTTGTELAAYTVARRKRIQQRQARAERLAALNTHRRTA